MLRAVSSALTVWRRQESAFNDNKQETIYREDCNTNLLADTQNKK